MSTIIDQLEKEQIRTDLPEFSAGDTVKVQVKIQEDGTRSRLQAFEGVVIAKSKNDDNLNASFTVRKISHGEGVERVFQTHSKMIDSIEVTRRGDVRRAKLYYLRERSGKSARLKEDLSKKASQKISKTAAPKAEPAPADDAAASDSE